MQAIVQPEAAGPTGPSATVPEISLVIPVCNERENLPILAGEIRGALGDHSYEVIWVDDGSTDGSAEALAGIAGRDPRVRVLRLARNAGQSAALAAGFHAARGAVVVTLDADLQNDPADIPRLLAEMAEPPGWDLVCGVRAQRHDDWIRRLSSRIANGVRNWATDERITDIGCSLKACRTGFLLRIPLFDGMHRFLPTLVRMEGARIREVVVHHRPRLHGTTKYGIGNRLFRGLADLAAVRWMQRRRLGSRAEATELTAGRDDPSRELPAKPALAYGDRSHGDL
jgi:glycosyltransferase involved in cell wall biosynthesis